MDWALGGVAAALLAVGLIGQGFEMRRMNKPALDEGLAGSPNLFADKRNYKWYAMIGAGLLLWLVAERL